MMESEKGNNGWPKMVAKEGKVLPFACCSRLQEMEKEEEKRMKEREEVGYIYKEGKDYNNIVIPNTLKETCVSFTKSCVPMKRNPRLGQRARRGNKIRVQENANIAFEEKDKKSW